MRSVIQISGSILALLLYLFVFTEIPFAEEEKAGYELKIPTGLDEDFVVIPKDNLLTAEKIELGKTLFFDTRLSRDDTVACATCHNPERAFTDGLPVSVGIGGKKGTRNVPTIINRVFGTEQFWDGRVPSLEEQAKFSLINPVEMDMPGHDELVEKLNKIEGYRKWFRKVFGTDVTLDGIVKAIASFERTVMSGGAPLDIYYYDDEKAISESARRGLEIFKGKARCTQCHAGFNFTDELYHNIGIGWDKGIVDLGRFIFTGQKKEGEQSEKKDEGKGLLGLLLESNTMRDIGSFKTPSLREVFNTAPYMHNGSIATLREVINFYNQGGVENPFLDKEMRELNLTEEEKDDLLEFLNSLSGGGGWNQNTPPDSFPE